MGRLLIIFHRLFANAASHQAWRFRCLNELTAGILTWH